MRHRAAEPVDGIVGARCRTESGVGIKSCVLPHRSDGGRRYIGHPPESDGGRETVGVVGGDVQYCAAGECGGSGIAKLHRIVHILSAGNGHVGFKTVGVLKHQPAVKSGAEIEIYRILESIVAEELRTRIVARNDAALEDIVVGRQVAGTRKIALSYSIQVKVVGQYNVSLVGFWRTSFHVQLGAEAIGSRHLDSPERDARCAAPGGYVNVSRPGSSRVGGVLEQQIRQFLCRATHLNADILVAVGELEPRTGTRHGEREVIATQVQIGVDAGGVAAADEHLRVAQSQGANHIVDVAHPSIIIGSGQIVAVDRDTVGVQRASPQGQPVGGVKGVRAVERPGRTRLVE